MVGVVKLPMFKTEVVRRYITYPLPPISILSYVNNNNVCTVLYCIAVPVPKPVWGKTRFRANLNLAASSPTTKASRCQ